MHQLHRRKAAVTLQILVLSNERPSFSGMGAVIGKEPLVSSYYRATYHGSVNREITPFSWSTSLEFKGVGESSAFNANHLRLEAELNGGYQYEKNRFLRWRAFGGVFLVNDLRDRATRSSSGFSLVDNAASDYRYDDLYLGRNLGGRNEQQTWPPARWFPSAHQFVFCLWY